jgi:hypothetical protein
MHSISTPGIQPEAVRAKLDSGVNGGEGSFTLRASKWNTQAVSGARRDGRRA